MKKLSVVLFALILAAAWTGAAFADVTMYGSTRFATFYRDVNVAAPGVDTEDFIFDLQTNSRLGGRFKTGDVQGLVELGVNPSSISLRHIYGSYDFGPGVFLVGQTERPYAYFGGLISENDNQLGGFGALNNRRAQMRLALKMGLYGALVTNSGANNQADDIEWPQLAVGYNGDVAGVAFGVHGAYAKNELTGPTGTPADKDVDGWLLAANVKAPVGPVTLLARVFYGQNLVLMGLKEGLVTPTATQDYDSYGGWIGAQFKVNDMVSINAGVGYNNTEAGTTGQLDNDQIAYYVNAPIKVAKGFTVVPEIAIVDRLDDATNASTASTDGAQATYIGAKWQFDF